MRILLSTIIALPLCLAISPLPTPTIASASPANLQSSIYASPTAAPLVERCDEEHCSFGGSESTLQASVVTSTILSTTSVPCYITTYITNSETVTETIYSTEIITSTMTKDGTVFIIQYSPTPVLMSTPITSVMEITNTWWSYWLTSSGDSYQVTSKGGETIYGGDSNTYTQQGDGWNGNDNNDGWSSDEVGGWSSKSNENGWGNTDTGSAWTHVNNNNAVSATSIPAGGVTVANNNGWGTTGSNGVMGTGTNYDGLANWNGGSSRISRAKGWGTKVTLTIAVAMVVVWEINHFFL
ncbi:hypothetical protein L486_02970 [Kwoniella mangroviensis CBS 10435]|uniref:Uncharacterized protein n=1 Tax=Kwoniella mangroviensis CBS 10435 TaxID=1331196 RepID=A0A1B9IXN3_9TREE|nr:hypothetical protein L486_02970 [Kwoniella mangroviensis CBS 10435]